MLGLFHEHWYVMLFLLVVGHLLADFPLQGPYLSVAKNPNSEEGKDGWWTYCMFSHVMIHAGSVYLFTGSFGCAFIEAVGHAFIDYGKCMGWLSAKLDQKLHIGMKVIYVALVFVSG